MDFILCGSRKTVEVFKERKFSGLSALWRCFTEQNPDFWQAKRCDKIKGENKSSGPGSLRKALFNIHEGGHFRSMAVFEIIHSWWFLLFTVYTLITVLNQQIFFEHCLGVHSGTLSLVFQKQGVKGQLFIDLGNLRIGCNLWTWKESNQENLLFQRLDFLSNCKPIHF